MKDVFDRIAQQCLVPSGKKISLHKDYPTDVNLQGVSKDDLRQRLADGINVMMKEQDMLYAQKTHALLIILQAMDAAGKDSLIKHVMGGVNPQGCEVHSFKAPSRDDLSHDYLWRANKVLPERGCIGIFNRSYYEEVLVVRVHPEYLENEQLPPKLINKKIWKRRFDEINNYEKYLVDNGITVLKFYLHLSKNEQKKRFLQRIDRPEKNWKFEAADVNERQFWTEYMEAYEDCISHTSTEWAPWHVVPADSKTVTRLVVADVINDRLKQLKLRYPAVNEKQTAELERAKRLLLQEGQPAKSRSSSKSGRQSSP